MVHRIRPCPMCGKDTSVSLSTDPPLVMVDGAPAHAHCVPEPTAPACHYCNDKIFDGDGYGSPCQECPAGRAAHHSEVRGTFG
jgi:hypothetical protein